MGTLLKNYWTTVLGFLSGFVYYLAQSGATAPATKQDWINLFLGALLAGLGLVAKDAKTGSKPQ